ncbi:hypothetical protein A2U01_0096154, partial [Trifolium medium]|nr:hypothetical protein [Trifolium medium]
GAEERTEEEAGNAEEAGED